MPVSPLLHAERADRQVHLATVNLAGAITTVNTASRGGGYQLSKSTHDQLPVLLNLHTGRLTALGLPAPFTSGVVNVVTDAGDPFGDLFNQSDLEAVTWVKGRPVDLNSWFTKAQLLGHKLTGIADANTNGQFVGSAEVSADTWAYIASPKPAYKLANVVAWVAQTSRLSSRAARAARSRRRTGRRSAGPPRIRASTCTRP